MPYVNVDPVITVATVCIIDPVVTVQYVLLTL